jgi:hypothetical protein
VSSCGFWPGNGGYGRAAFYVYAYPEPAGYGDTRLATADAFYDTGLGQFILPYDAVRKSSEPDALLLGFCRKPTPPRSSSQNGTAKAWSGNAGRRLADRAGRAASLAVSQAVIPSS